MSRFNSFFRELVVQAFFFFSIFGFFILCRRSGPRTNFTSTSAKSDGSKTAADDGEDNWEMPVDSLPV